MTESRAEDKEERSAFTDAAYIPRNELPNMPRVIHYAPKKEAAHDKGKNSHRRSAGAAAALCIICLFLGAGLNELRHENKKDGAEPPAAAEAPSEQILPGPVAAADLTETNIETLPDTPHPYMGVIVQTVSQTVADYYNQYNSNSAIVGAQVFAVEENSSAAKAGIRKGDIITALGDHSIASAFDLSLAESRFRPGDTASVQLFREGESAAVEIVFTERHPAGEGSAAYFSFDEGW